MKAISIIFTKMLSVFFYGKIGDKLKTLSATADPVPGFNLYIEDFLKIIKMK
jgi:hypothetical protein